VLDSANGITISEWMRQGGRVQPIFDNETIRVYQAYSDTIADTTLKADTFVAPPFKINWMTSSHRFSG
jgi:hypothetical protein